MTLKTETRHAGEFMVSEANGARSREAITVLSGQNLVAGAIIAAVAIGTASIVAAAVAGNTGNGVMTIADPAFAAGVKAGAYRVTCIEPATNGGTFTVEDPEGIEIGVADVGVAFDDVVKFTIADGATDFAEGDSFTVTVGAGSGKYVEYDPTGADGRQTAAGILYDAVDASLADAAGVGILRDAEFNADEVAWFTDADAGEITTGTAELALKGIIGR